MKNKAETVSELSSILGRFAQRVGDDWGGYVPWDRRVYVENIAECIKELNEYYNNKKATKKHPLEGVYQHAISGEQYFCNQENKKKSKTRRGK